MLFTSFIIGFAIASFSLSILLLLSQIAFKYGSSIYYKIGAIIISLSFGVTASLFYNAICS